MLSVQPRLPYANRRPLKIIIGAVNSGTKLCDPAVSAPDARACP